MTHEMLALAKATPAQLDLAMLGVVIVGIFGIVAGIWLALEYRKQKRQPQPARTRGRPRKGARGSGRTPTPRSRGGNHEH